MKSWLGLVLAPGIALGAQGVLYAMVTPACGAQAGTALHLAAAVALGLVLALAALSFGHSSLRRREPASPDSDEGREPVSRRFLADLATAVAALSALVILGMWFALWVLSPCVP